MEEDLTFRLDMLSYGIDRHRFCCVSGHSVYTAQCAGRSALSQGHALLRCLRRAGGGDYEFPSVRAPAA